MPTLPEEKRKSIRLPVDLEAHFRKNKKEYAGRILNLSGDGVFVECHQLFNANDILDFSFRLPGIKDSIHVRAKVVWGGSIEGSTQRTYGMGIHFEEMNPSHQEEIAAYIRNLLQT